MEAKTERLTGDNGKYSDQDTMTDFEYELYCKVKQYEDAIESANEMVAVQGGEGNWNHSDYMLGLYNGMEFILSIFEGRAPVYRELESEDEVEPEVEPIAVESEYFNDDSCDCNCGCEGGQ